MTTMEEPLVSIITPCYNQAQYLSEALDSVLRQTFANWECIIVNDCSSDNTEEVAMSYCNKDARFRYCPLDHNQGLCTARNNGIGMSSGKYILPLDADDIIADCYLEEAVKNIVSNIALNKAEEIRVRGDAFDVMRNHPDIFMEYVEHLKGFCTDLGASKMDAYGNTITHQLSTDLNKKEMKIVFIITKAQ